MSYCNWENTSELNIEYHDNEWGVPLHKDQGQFEYLMMEVMQCGLNWNMVINKREIFRKCFDNFNYDKIASYDLKDIERILKTEGMIKSRSKVEAIINNAKCFKKIRKEFGSFAQYLWAYSSNKTILYNEHKKGFIPTSNGLSYQISQDLKRRGFKFLGPITIYSHLQACGVINDHDQNCPRYAYINKNYPTICKEQDHEKNVCCYV